MIRSTGAIFLHIAASVVFAATVSAAACAEESPANGGLFGSRFRFTESTGADIYKYVCAGCHMPDGKGADGAGRYPSLAGDPALSSAAYPIGITLRGNRAMPPFAGLLSNEQIAAVVDYIRTNFGNSFSPTATPDEVKAAR